eukprot:Hpha_TRINITY_DN11901_c0_g1::TRINITY_DN11901_c0_g1_i1::g.20672::m.20672
MSLESQGTMPTAASSLAQGTMPTAASASLSQGTMPTAPSLQQGTMPTAPPSFEAQGTVALAGDLRPAGAPTPLEVQGTVAAAAQQTEGIAESSNISPIMSPRKRIVSCTVHPYSDFEERYSVGERLGEGSFATVKKAIDLKTTTLYAAKIIDKRKAGMQALDSILYEVEIMAQLDHPYLVRMHSAYEGPQNVVIVLDYVAGQTLFDRIIESKHYDEHMAAIATTYLLEGIAYMHEKGVMHRDLKPENLLMKRPRVCSPDHADYVHEMTEVVIADFGLATRPPSRSVCGSPAYVAPEILLTQSGDGNYGVSCDVWSLGVIIYVMFCGAFPWKDKTDAKTFHLILTAPLTFGQDAWAEVSGDATGFLKELLEKDPDERPSAEDSLRLRWISERDKARRMHMEKTRLGLQRFRLREKVTTVMNVFRGARRLRMGIFGRHPQKDEPEIPPFAKYIKCESEVNPVIPVQSQTDPSKIYEVNLGLCNSAAGLSNRSDFSLSKICNCASVKVCRHLQYVYQWLFLGDRHLDYAPHISELENRKRVLEDSVSMYREDDNDADKLHKHLDSYKTLIGVCNMLLCARDFKYVFELVPETEKKAILGGLMPRSYRKKTGEDAEDVLDSTIKTEKTEDGEACPTEGSMQFPPAPDGPPDATM